MNWCWNKAFRWPEHAGSWKSTYPSPRSEYNRKGREDCRGKSKSKRNMSTMKSTVEPHSPSISQRPVSILSSFFGRPYSRSWYLASGTLQYDLYFIWCFASILHFALLLIELFETREKERTLCNLAVSIELELDSNCFSYRWPFS